MGQTDENGGDLIRQSEADISHDSLPQLLDATTNGSDKPGSIPAPLDTIGMIELLEHDGRPTFIIDLNHIRRSTPDVLRVIYFNASLRSRTALGTLVLGMGASEMMTVAYGGFKTWIENNLEHDDPTTASPISFGGIFWTAFTLRDRYRIVSGILDSQSLDFVSSKRQHGGSEGDGENSYIPRLAKEGLHRYSLGDIHQDTPSAPLTTTIVSHDHPDEFVNPGPVPRHVQFFRDFDWGSTALGPMTTWSPLLRQTCKLLMADVNPVFLFWGEDMILVYNEAAIVVVAEKHPLAMGKPGKESFGEVWGDFSAQFASVRISGKPLRQEHAPAHLHRHGRLDECYVTYTYLPVTNEKGKVVGIYETFQDVTRQVLSERRLSTLLEISTCSANVKETKLFWKRLLQALDSNHYDVPFMILYSVEETWLENPKASDGEHMRSHKTCTLEGSLGIPDDHITTPARLNLEEGTDGYSSAFRKAIEVEDSIILRIEDGTLPEAYVNGFGSRGFGDPCNAAVVCPVRPTGGENVVGFLVLGLNPRQGYGDEERQFIDILSRQIATSVAAVALLDEEVRRGRTYAHQAVLDQAKLERQLDRRTQELMNSENKFEIMAGLSPVGMFTCDPSGRIAYANKAWYQILGHPGNDDSKESWLACFEGKEIDNINSHFLQLITTHDPTTFEISLKRQWNKQLTSGETVRTAAWILVSAYVEILEDGSLSGARCSVTDISELKWAEEIQRNRMEEAIERKRQQEAFIDMTSHEMRNPLSAIIQCADTITNSLGNLRPNLQKAPAVRSLLEDLIDTNLDAAETITLCAEHQKRIVDDVLTLSKLDSDMLLITPVDVRPLQVAQHVMRIFKGESKKHGTELVLQVEESFRKTQIDWVLLDPSRLTQVLVNILGNALKFTQTAVNGSITLSIGASLQQPSEADQGVEYIPVRNLISPRAEKDPKTAKEVGETVYLHYAVRDTGLGLSPTEKQMLFKRFGQASPRTHVEYGGSGLGLFISRKLTELQGGAIGFSSELGKGSTFAFYVKAERSAMSQISDDAANANSTSNNPNLQLEQRKLSVLVVEDNLVNQKVLCKQLRSYGYIVHAANHGGEALAFLQDTRYWHGKEKSGVPLSVVLMDTEMPVMDGLTCVRKIRKLQREGLITRHIPIISVTANAREEQIEVARNSGMDDVVSKPFRVTELVPKMQALARQYLT